MNKIEVSIRDCKMYIKDLQDQQMIVNAQLDVLKEQLINLEKIRDNKHIPHDDRHEPMALTPVDQIYCKEGGEQ